MKWKLLTFNQKFVLLLFNCLLHLNLLTSTSGDVFKLGYITGSHRRHGNQEYERPGEFRLKLVFLNINFPSHSSHLLKMLRLNAQCNFLSSFQVLLFHAQLLFKIE